MNLFYNPDHQQNHHFLTDEEFSHCTRVLRKQVGDEIHITDGKGLMVAAVISNIEKRRLNYQVINEEGLPRKPFHLHVAISPTKQLERMEWFVEKASEMGADEISFFTSKNSERKNIKLDRLDKKVISALKQSKGAWKTQINEMLSFQKILQIEADKKCIAWVADKEIYFLDAIRKDQSVLILIGPEGDFTREEIELAGAKGFLEVSLGSRVLRTETAGIAAVQMVNSVNRF